MVLNNARQELFRLRKDLIYFSCTVKKIKLETVKFRYSLKEISTIVLISAYISYFFVPIYSNIMWAISFVKGSSLIVTGGIVTGTGVLVTAAIINMQPIQQKSNSNIDRTVSTKYIDTIVQDTYPVKDKTQSLKISTQKFTPKKAEILKIDGETLSGVVFNYNKESLIIEVEHKNIVVYQKDIYNIAWGKK